MNAVELEVADWRRQVSELYSSVRGEDDPERGHVLWREGREVLLRTHPQSPLGPDDPIRIHGVPYWPYDPSLRFELDLCAPAAPRRLALPTDHGGTTEMRLLGVVALPTPLSATVDVWWLEQYGGGIFLPVRDGTSGDTSYGGGRYALDTAKGADLGGGEGTLVVDLNFLYHPSCRYDPQWECPLAPPGNVIEARVHAGERL
jgi:uncharacterized protein (DUF1684 family)